jgi:hypothetical protein
MLREQKYVCYTCKRVFYNRTNLSQHFWCIDPRDRESVFSRRGSKLKKKFKRTACVKISSKPRKNKK